LPWDLYRIWDYDSSNTTILVAWAKYGTWGAISMALFFIIINTVAESYIFPKLTGKGLQMSVFVVFVSLFVWG
jgi:predicted PurR-regulated permease PerM